MHLRLVAAAAVRDGADVAVAGGVPDVVVAVGQGVLIKYIKKISIFCISFFVSKFRYFSFYTHTVKIHQ